MTPPLSPTTPPASWDRQADVATTPPNLFGWANVESTCEDPKTPPRLPQTVGELLQEWGIPQKLKYGAAPLPLSEMGNKFLSIALRMVIFPNDIDWNSPDTVWVEQQMTFYFRAMTFKERGPPRPTQGGPQTWRGQPWRAGSNR